MFGRFLRPPPSWQCRISAIVLLAVSVLAGVLGMRDLGATTASAFPTRPSVSLGEGHVGPYQWAVEVLPGGKRLQPGSLCLSTALREPTEGSVFENCGPIISGLVETTQAGTPRKPMEVVVFLLPGSLDRLYLKLSGQPGKTFPLKKLSASDLTSISDVPLSSFAHAYARRVCLQHYIGYNEAGKIAFSGRRACHH